MNIFDVHTHIHFPAYDTDREEVIKRAQAAGVKMIAVGTNFQTSQEAVFLAEKYSDDLWATVGFHPSHVIENTPAVIAIPQGREKQSLPYFDKNELRQPIPEQFNLESFRKLAKHPKVVAIGECGLDYFRVKGTASSVRELQKEVFVEQIKLAEEFQKPLMIHCRSSKGTDDAYENLLEIFKYDTNIRMGTTDTNVIIHFFVGSLPIAKKLLEIGCYFTFGGVITFVRDYDEVIKYLPLDRILLETDAPYVAPVPYRGQRNEPAYVIEVAKKMAEIKETDLKKIIQTTTENTKSLFNI